MSESDHVNREDGAIAPTSVAPSITQQGKLELVSHAPQAVEPVPQPDLTSWPSASNTDGSKANVFDSGAGIAGLLHTAFLMRPQSPSQGATAIDLPDQNCEPLARDTATGDDDQQEDAGKGKKRGRPVTHTGDPEDKNSIQEKNRQAQARFRQRQKDKMSVLGTQVKELKADKARLVEENKALLNRKSILEKVLALKEEQIQVLQNGAGLFPESNPPCAQVGGAQVGGAQALAAEPSASEAGITCEQLITVWKETVKAVSRLLIKLDTEGENAEVLAQIEDLMAGTAKMCCKVSFENPTAVKRFVATCFHDGPMPPCKLSHWQDVVKQLNLTPGQQSDMLNLAHKFRTEMASVLDLRREMLRLLEQPSPDASSCLVQASHSLQAGDAVAKLQELQRREHEAHSEYMMAVIDKVWSRLQLAQASVTSYPFFPDALKMCEMLENEQAKGSMA